MPTYTYTNHETGQSIEVVRSMHKPIPRKLHRTAGIFHRDVARDFRGRKSKLECWPMKCTALGVIPQQVEAAKEEAVRLGCRTDFHPDGDAIVRDRAHYNKLQRVLGHHNRDAGYGDRTPP